MNRNTLPFLVALAALGCGHDYPPAGPRPTEPGPPLPPPPDLSCESVAPPVVEPWTWKRVGPLATDLSNALALDPNAMCTELGDAACVEVHNVPLGGSDPLGTGLYTPPAAPLATTPMAVDRLVLAACARGVDRDATGPAVVVTSIDLGASTLDPDDASTRTSMDQDSTSLYRRLLARDPSADELGILRDLARPDAAGLAPSAREWATLSCYAVGTSTEMLFL